MNNMYNADIKRCLKNRWQKNFFEFCLTSNPEIPEYQDLAFSFKDSKSGPPRNTLQHCKRYFGTHVDLQPTADQLFSTL
jgi:hypothetical protein